MSGAKKQNIALLTVENFRSVTGGGVAGRINGQAVIVGKPDFLLNEGTDDVTAFEASAIQFQNAGKTALFVAIGEKVAGILTVADSIKETAPHSIIELWDLGIRIVILTGESRRSAAAVAASLGITAVEPEVDPSGKAAHIRKLRMEGKHPAMVGDGINDAPALSEAEIGIAMGTGTGVAIQSAGITFVQGKLRGIAKAIRLSRGVMRNIRQNLFFSFIYNAAGIPLAAGVLCPITGTLLSPIIAVTAMSLSSVSVISDALRLRNLRLH